MENKKAKTILSESWKNFKEAGENFLDSVKNTAKWIYKLIDAWDTYLWWKIWTSHYKTINWVKNNIFKILILWSSIVYSWDKIYEKIIMHQDQEQNKVRAIKLNFSSMEKNTFWNRPVFFKKDLDQDIKNKQTIEQLDNWITLLHDAGLTFYLMTAKDIKNKDKTHSSRTNTIEHIREKLSQLPQFSYLNEDEYKPSNNVVTNSFNIRPDFKRLAQNSKLDKTPFWIPIPLKKEVREITDKIFKESWELAVDILGWYNEDYQYIRDKVEKKYSKENIAKLLTSVALVETWRTTSTIWTDTYHRREAWSHNCFSFWPSHVLMENGWIKSRRKLGVTEWQMYHPIVSNVVVLWFMIEKIKEKWIKNKDKIADELISILSFINEDYIKTTDKSLNKFSSFYNWASYKKNSYHTRLSKAFNKLNIKEKFLTNSDDFTFLNINSWWSHIVYSYQIKEEETKSIRTNASIRKEFKRQYDFDGDNILICRKSWEAYSDKIIYQPGKTVYIKLAISEALK